MSQKAEIESRARLDQYARARGLTVEQFKELAAVDYMRRYSVAEPFVAVSGDLAGQAARSTFVNKSNNTYNLLSNWNFAPNIVAHIKLKLESLFPNSFFDGMKGLRIGVQFGFVMGFFAGIFSVVAWANTFS